MNPSAALFNQYFLKNNIDWAAPPFRAREALLTPAALFWIPVYIDYIHRKIFF